MQGHEFLAVVRKREGIIFEGGVVAVSSVNEAGEFDVLANHAQFVSAVSEYVVLYLPNGEQQKVEIVQGILRAKGNEVEVYVGIG